MKSLFDPVSIGGIPLKNRIIRSATLERAADGQGRFAEFLTPIYTALAEGGVGAVISGMMGVGPNACLLPSMADAGTDAAVPELKKLVALLHTHDCKFVVQLSHCGRRVTVTENDGPALGPSDWTQASGKPARAMTADDIRLMVRNFAEAALRCKEAGVDGVQLHGAHGYCLSQFLSPYCNKRTDEYGGDIKGRGRVVLEVYDAVRAAVGPEYPIWIKLSCRELVDEATTWDEFLWLCKALEERGLDAIEVSGGIGETRESASAQFVKDEEDEGTFAPEALKLAEEVAISIISVCGYRTPSVIDDRLNKGGIEAVSLCRPLLAEPGLVRRWKEGDTEKSVCISCNKCFVPKLGYGCQVFR